MDRMHKTDKTGDLQMYPLFLGHLHVNLSGFTFQSLVIFI